MCQQNYHDLQGRIILLAFLIYHLKVWCVCANIESDFWCVCVQIYSLISGVCVQIYGVQNE